VGWTCGYRSEAKVCVQDFGWGNLLENVSTRKIDKVLGGWCAVGNFGIDDIELSGYAITL
jgi:hypothetical protein